MAHRVPLTAPLPQGGYNLESHSFSFLPFRQGFQARKSPVSVTLCCCSPRGRQVPIYLRKVAETLTICYALGMSVP